MFRRRNQRPISRRVLGFFWPHIGWRRATRYMLHRLARLPGSPHSIAAGFACGAAVSFTPFVGLHFVFGAIIAWMIRSNIVASAIGTAVGNPWTFPFIWTWLFSSGNWMIALGDPAKMKTPDFGEFFASMMEAALTFDLTYLVDTAAPVFWPMFVSGIPTAIVAWWIHYVPLKFIIERYQARRFSKRRARAAKSGE
jgi:uncharacterized protein